MFILWGTQTFKVKRTAFRREYCVNCNRLAYSYLTRTLTVFTVFFVPLIPLGFRRKWQCAFCGKKPEKVERTGLPFKIIGLVFLVMVFWASFTVDDAGSDPAVENAMRVILVGLMVVAAVSIVRHKSPSCEERMRINSNLGHLSPEVICPFCETHFHLIEGRKWCRKCELEYREA